MGLTTTAFLSLLIFGAFALEFAGALTCTKGEATKRTVFSCPGPKGDSSKIFCCGPNHSQTCCNFFDFLKDGRPYAIAMIIGMGILIAYIFLPFLCGILLLFANFIAILIHFSSLSQVFAVLLLIVFIACCIRHCCSR